jgi:hypothetical protein
MLKPLKAVISIRFSLSYKGKPEHTRRRTYVRTSSARFQLEKKSLVVGLKELDAKKN